MRAARQPRHQIGRYWLWQRPGVGTWSICWLDRDAGGRSVTRRKSISVGGGSPADPPQDALDALAAYHVSTSQPRYQSREVALVEAEMAEWLKHHVSQLAAPDRYVYSVKRWQMFFGLERLQGRLVGGPTVADITPDLIARFREFRAGQGAGGHTISRDLAALRGALNWSWKQQRIDHPPFIADVPLHQKAPPRDRVLSVEEVAAILDACAGRTDRQHLARFIIIELGTAGRPQAVIELTDRNIDLVRGLIDPNQPGRVHYRKRRAIVPIADNVRPWLVGIEGKLIRYSVPRLKGAADGAMLPNFERSTASIRTSWKAACREALVENATPKTLRHTMLTWLAERGVPYEQRQVLAGHARLGTTARNYEHLSPSYLRDAVAEIDLCLTQIRRSCTRFDWRPENTRH